MLGTARKILLLSNSGEAPNVEQGTGNQTTGGATSDTATFANTTVTGRGVIVVLALKGARQVSSITDNKSNTYVLVRRVADSTDCSVEMWYCQPISGGASHTITVTFDGTTYCVWGAVEVSRVQGGGAFLDTRTINTKTRGGSGSSAAISITSGLPRAANELFVAMCGIAGGGADAGIDTPTNWTDITLFQDYDGIMAGMGNYRVNTSANTLSATWTNDTTTSPYAAIIAGFRGFNAVSGAIAPPENTVAPAITGTTTQGQTLTCSTGTWSGSPVAYTYQWKDDGVAISGAVASTYVLTASEVGATITCTVTAYNDGGSTSATATGVGPIVSTYLTDRIATAPKLAASPWRVLREAYVGPLIRVRRSSDSTEQDINAVGGVLDTASLLTFVGAGNGFLRRVYDQSGNGYNIGNSTAAEQPLLVSSGSLVTTLNSLPSPTWDGSNDYFVAANALSNFVSASAYTAFSSSRPTGGHTSGGAFAAYIYGDAGGYWNAGTDTGPSLDMGHWDGNGEYVQRTPPGGSWPAVCVTAHRFSGGTIRGCINGGTEGTVAQGNISTLTNTMLFGRNYNATAYFPGVIGEIVIYNTALSTADTNTIGSDMATQVGVTWTTIT